MRGTPILAATGGHTGEVIMPFLVILAILFVAFHFTFLLKTIFAIIFALALTIGLWVLWKLKWVILAIFGLEELF